MLANGPSPQGEAVRILFLGNSHTAANDVPGLVRSLLESGGVKAETESITGGHLDDLEPRQNVRDRIDKGKFKYVVLQGAMISSSHKYDYPQDKAIALAKRAVKAGSTPLYFAEWPRKDWDESDYITKHYELIRKAAGGDTVPVCYAWVRSVGENKGFDPWAADGNHAQLAGSYIAASTIAYWIAPDASLTFAPKGIEPGLASRLRQAAYNTVAERKRR